MDTLTFRYRLPVTKVVVSGKRTMVTNRHADPRESTTRNSSILVEITSDEREWRTLALQHDKFDGRRFEIAVTPDGRLVSLNSALEDKSESRTKAALSVGVATAGAMAPALVGFGPLGLAAAAVVGTAAGGVTYFSNPGIRALWSETTPSQAQTADALVKRPELSELGVPGAYAAARKGDAEVLAHFRWSEMCLTARMAQLATPESAKNPRELAADLRAVHKSLSLVRTGLLESERAFAEWLATHSVTKVDAYDESFFIDDLPTTKELSAAAEDGFPFNGPAWSSLFEDLRVAVSCDFLESAPSSGEHPVSRPADDSDVLWHRRPRLAEITHWQVTKTGGKYEVQPTLVERKLVLVPGSEEALPLIAESDEGEVTAAFDADGLLTQFGFDLNDRSIGRAQAISELPGVVKGALEAGQAIGDPWSTTSRAAELKAQVELLETRAKLDKARGGPPAPDRLQSLRDTLEEAELKARLARAKLISSDPTHSLVEFSLRE